MTRKPGEHFSPIPELTPRKSKHADIDYSYERLLELALGGGWGVLLEMARTGTLLTKLRLIDVSVVASSPWGRDDVWNEHHHLRDALGFPFCPQCGQTDLDTCSEKSDGFYNCLNGECGRQKFTVAEAIEAWEERQDRENS